MKAKRFSVVGCNDYSMTRCDFDGVFYRVFCVTLLAIAFTFTVILTNVFIDIDGLLSSNEKAKNYDSLPPEPEMRNKDVSEAHYAVYQNNKPVMTFQDNPEIKFDINKPEIQFQEKRAENFYKNNYEDDAEDASRTKRSLDSENFKFHIKNPKMKKILTNRLATLLEELDAEETESAKIRNLKVERTKEDIEKVTERMSKMKEAKYLKSRRYNSEQDVTEDNHEDKILHLAMHNILLQGILGHMDLSEVYTKVRSLLKNIEREGMLTNGRRQGNEVKTKSSEALKDSTSKRYSKVEAKFFDEIVNCDELEKEVTNESDLRNLGDTRRSISGPKKEPNMLIKTVIDITSLNKNKKKDNSSNSKEDIKGIIKLIYNGKSIKFNRMDDEEEVSKNIKPIEKVPDTTTKDPKADARRQIEKGAADFLKGDLKNSNVPNEFLNKAISEYFNNHRNTEAIDLIRGKRSSGYKTTFDGKRPKRNIKIRGEKHNTIEPNKQSKIKKKNDDELYVEIETHFDNKGSNGDQKKKLIKDIVEKIRKAIQVDMEGTKNKSKYMHVKKRIQNPLNYKRDPLHHVLSPTDKIELRQSHPINKITAVDDNTPNLSDKSGENWKQTFVGPKFLSSSKSINSGEMGQLNLQYNKEIEVNSIPQRLQQPLNPEGNDEPETGLAYNDLGNLKFFIKEIDGSGFAIGFNQYVAESPDPEAIKLFTGIQNLIKSYHQNYDEPDPTTETDIMNKVSSTDNISEELNIYQKDRNHELNKRQINSNRNKIHKIVRRSTDDNRQGYHSNEYKMVFKNNYLPYDSYQEIYEDKNNKVSLSLQRNLDNATYHSNKINKSLEGSASKIKESPFVISENIFYKDLKPSELFDIASLLDRKKRGVKLQQVVKMNTKKTINRYLNRNTKFSKKIFLKNKRNKRQIEKIRIIASDKLPNLPRHSEENVFVISNEHLYADRAVVREVEHPEVGDTNEKPQEEHYDNSSPYVYETPQQPSYISSIFSSRFRHNPLMSKYPHIFMEEVSRSKEDTENPKFYNDNLHQALDNPGNRRIGITLVTTERYLPSLVEIPSPNLQDIDDTSKGNFKLTVKVQPKNNTSRIKGGFKEIHTSINKSITKDGLLYSSMVNLSEISKIENVIKPKNLVETRRSDIGITRSDTGIPLLNYIKEQQEKMKMLLKEHKMSADEQLSNFKTPNVKSEDGKDKKSNELIDVIIPFNPPQILRLNKHEAGQLISSALMKLHSVPHINDLTFLTTTPTSTASQTTVQTTTSAPTTTSTTTPPSTTKDPERAEIIKTIQHNENLTNMILKRINKNTDILQTFLSKLANRMEPVHDFKKKEIEQSNTGQKLFKLPIPMDMSIPKEWKAQYITSSFFAQPISNFEYRNTSVPGIPFVYAYQHPLSVTNTNNMPVANVVYHGHIHANTAHKKGNLKEIHESTDKTPKVAKNNETRFFIDDLDAMYKEVPKRSAKFNITVA